jgi:nitroimidazol reductase NimA-like FMN-containing flavoprotein (pyridoxamine 5'-phosphate oxidase superfamily)
MILARHNVGRIAFAFHDRVGIEPIHYVYEHGILYGRTSHGSKLDVLAHHPWVAFEVDEIEGLFDWRSVEVKGTFDRADDAGSPIERAAWQHAVELLSVLVPGTMSANDPAPFRTVVFRIHVNEITGRQASS